MAIVCYETVDMLFFYEIKEEDIEEAVEYIENLPGFLR